MEERSELETKFRVHNWTVGAPGIGKIALEKKSREKTLQPSGEPCVITILKVQSKSLRWGREVTGKPKECCVTGEEIFQDGMSQSEYYWDSKQYEISKTAIGFGHLGVSH